MNVRWFVDQQERGGVPRELREMGGASRARWGRRCSPTTKPSDFPDSLVTATQPDAQAFCDALNVGHNALVNARWAGDQPERGGMLLKRLEMQRGFPDFDAAQRPSPLDALNVGHTALVKARRFVDQGSAAECF